MPSEITNKETNAFILYPRLKEEFDFSKNNNNNIEYITCGSNKKFWFICNQCNKSIFISIKNRIRAINGAINATSCRHAATVANRKAKVNKSLLEHSPYLLKEWDYNLNKESPDKINFGTEKLAHWICSKCNSNYESKINHRVDGSGCPFCAGKKVNNTNCLTSIYPDISKHLKNPSIGNIITYRCYKKQNWICFKCNEEFSSRTYSVVTSFKKGFNGCPYCSGKQANHKNNITVTHPEIAKEWSYNKNESKPEQFTAGSGSRSKVWWICEKNHEWQASINARAGSKNKRGSGCPNCSHKISYPELAWINSLNISNLNFQKKININGKRFKLDAYDPATNTVYEFNGDYYHGNPDIFDSEDYNETCKKTFGELYQKTLDKEKLLISAGYNVITMWENDWNKLNNQIP